MTSNPSSTFPQGDFSAFNNIGNMSISGGSFTMIDNRGGHVYQTVDGNTSRGATAHPTFNIPLTRQRMPSKPHIFHGRDDLVREIAHLLCDETTSQRVSILGPGGMGKTSLALAVVETAVIKFRYGSCSFWIPCVEAASASLLLQVLYLHLQISRPTSSNDLLEDILSELNS